MTHTVAVLHVLLSKDPTATLHVIRHGSHSEELMWLPAAFPQSDRQIHPVIPGWEQVVMTEAAAINPNSSGVWSFYPLCGSETLQRAVGVLKGFPT